MVPGRAQLEAESRDPAVDGVPELLPPTDAMVNIIAGLIAHRSDAEAILAALASMLGAPTALLGDPGIPPSPEPAWLTDASAALAAGSPVAAAFAEWSRAAADRRRLRPPSASMPTPRARSMEPGPGRSGGVCHAALPLQSASDPLAAALARWSVEAADRRRFRTVVRSFRSSRHTVGQNLSPPTVACCGRGELIILLIVCQMLL